MLPSVRYSPTNKPPIHWISNLIGIVTSTWVGREWIHFVHRETGFTMAQLFQGRLWWYHTIHASRDSVLYWSNVCLWSVERIISLIWNTDKMDVRASFTSNSRKLCDYGGLIRQSCIQSMAHYMARCHHHQIVKSKAARRRRRWFVSWTSQCQ